MMSRRRFSKLAPSATSPAPTIAMTVQSSAVVDSTASSCRAATVSVTPPTITGACCRRQEPHATAAAAEPSVRRHPERLLVVDDGRSFFVRTADVDWIEAARNYVRLHAGDRTHLLRATLGALEQRLDPERFRRVSRSTLVNLDRVREVQPWFHGDAIVILESGAHVTLSRRYRANLLGTPVS